jgi:hypothetical protein
MKLFFTFNLGQHIVSSVQNEVEARVIGIGESEATQTQRDDQLQEQQFIKDGCKCVCVIVFHSDQNFWFVFVITVRNFVQGKF